MAHAPLHAARYDTRREHRSGALAQSVDTRDAAEEHSHVLAWTELDQENDQPTVLVVDDERAIAELLQEVLGSAGYRVLRATNGRTALAIARREHPALVLTDRMMPEVDGVEFVRRLRSSPVTRNIPVVLMSSTRPTPELVGNIPFLAKPFELDDLIHTVEVYARSEDSGREQAHVSHTPRNRH
jgi:CheY-like chemotaxis protein